ncbi:hypothetical protein ACFVUR_12450 [Stenotrophomonas bentonitica]|uniref:hypothetical protein n=1 Tax=Stenotrophomonas bentonitica TaxID=1450134 RepID=UPI0036E904F5
MSLDGTRCHAGRMPSSSVRSARCPLSNACYVVTNVTTHQFPLFHHHGNAQDVARWLRASDAERRTESFAWAIMPDRVHWLSLPMRAGLASGLHGYPFSWSRWPV